MIQNVALIVLLSITLSPQTMGQSGESQTATKKVVEKFFDAYVRKDIERCAALWSQTSPDLQTRIQALKAMFATTGDIKLNSLDILQVNFLPRIIFPCDSDSYGRFEWHGFANRKGI